MNKFDVPPLPVWVRDLDTPCLILDEDMLDANIRKMQERVTRAGRSLRPHAKTHKCSALARRQLAGGAIGVCVAKVSEAEALVQAGITDILVTGPVSTALKIGRLVALRAHAPGLMAVVESEAGIADLNAALIAQGLVMKVLLDLDVGLGRTGVLPSDALALASRIRSCAGLRLRGIQAYAGHVQHRRPYTERVTASRACLQPAAEVFRQLQSTDPDCSIFSTSGTGTVTEDLAVPEITDVQPGSYVCMDVEYFNIGSLDDPDRFDDFAPALRLLTTVISVRPNGSATVDAGLKALYRDGATPALFGPAYAGWTYHWFGDEYGRVTPPEGTKPPLVGTVIPMIVSHCDPTINLFDRFYRVRDGQVVGEWDIDLRGCSQ